MSTPRRLTGQQSLCRACNQLFASTYSFDCHRAGTYRPLTRKCLTHAEMRAKGMTVNRFGFWVSEARKYERIA
jgi:hypothetical protein